MSTVLLGPSVLFQRISGVHLKPGTPYSPLNIVRRIFINTTSSFAKEYIEATLSLGSLGAKLFSPEARGFKGLKEGPYKFK